MSSETFKVRLLPQGAIFDCAADQTLLLAGLAAGVAMPWSCRNGTCRTCITRLVDGRIEHRIPWPGLSIEEKADRLILPCVAEPRSSLTLAPADDAAEPQR
ncbi:2Fe-2S iron-sulfur cluster-binding protein [Roseateles cellulosilyticus]|uniref:2Fe-2S iron-sulfur cluster-binding protein n=1 Tax=Pelomonas cellulosilytica TaxID=2906762 RepID=A0ABS8XU87_9BURK|nr:2Fe-2S iron-sulfur cluster-binding protein [Pelomonas sp. P8]MCE4554778.1 2Fe-2S iron-sulfur cluster-binding protein [Pelomonas sp. P8]